MFDPGAADVVGAAILELLRHDEQGNASRARGRALPPGKNQIDDIVAPVLLATAGKDLAAGDPEAALRLLHRLRRDQRSTEARRGGKECGRTGRSRLSPITQTHKHKTT